jgi:hypothetical protein
MKIVRHPNIVRLYEVCLFVSMHLRNFISEVFLHHCSSVVFL